jgi:hypothetical protein
MENVGKSIKKMISTDYCGRRGTADKRFKIMVTNN